MAEDPVINETLIITEEEIIVDNNDDSELVFDPIKDMWVTVNIKSNDTFEDESDDKYWVWEVGDDDEEEGESENIGYFHKIQALYGELTALPRLTAHLMSQLYSHLVDIGAGQVCHLVITPFKKLYSVCVYVARMVRSIAM